ncbi:glycoside hydrolase family 2 TIM barrel-domain containing protein [Granulicella sp. dw_53]|uniref:glycoside hydrolase family 2 protein n=1 Tax=Granulicella sp. dw_53 TaxID=2719792 RepID=UPI001BD3DF20|nr:glycoside hydrolase family 2 TIM barrel-domain containing protein [Granulicella sp. dw_53]
MSLFSRMFRSLARTGLIASAGLSLPLAALAQEPLKTLLVDVDHRAATSLNGDWHYLVDQPPGRSLYTSEGKVRDNGYALNTHPIIDIDKGAHNEEYDFASAPTLKVPGDWNTQDPTLFRYEGVLWYQRDFTYQPKAESRTFLHIGAANYRSFVWVNEKRICDHEGGFTPFDCEVTAVLRPGNNFVVIAVDSTRMVDGIPSVGIDWFNYGGLTRDVSLIDVPKAFVDDYDIHLKRGTTDQLTGYIHVEGAPEGTTVNLSIPEVGATAALETDATGRAPFTLQTKALTLWSPESPKLYKVHIESGVGSLTDTLTDEIGFRDIRVEGTKILLNGKPIFLRGANEHAEAPYRTGRVSNQKDVDNIFSFLKELNANFVRLAHYPHDERMERTADRDGIMVWSEIPLWQHISFDKPEVYAKATFMLNEMIRRDRNKASVILWSVSNETPNNPTRTKFLTELANEARRLDPTRPITSALLGPKANGNEIVQDDPFTDALDVVGQNEYVGWYVMRPEDADKVHWTLPQKPILISEFGAEAKQGRHGGKNERWTEEQQVNVFEHQFVMFSKIPQVRGLVPWILADFRSPTRNIPKLQDGFNRKGLISEDGKKKLAFFQFQKIYKDKSVGKAE